MKPKVEEKPKRKPPDYAKAAKMVYRQGKTLKQAMEAIGISPKQAARGRNVLARRSKKFAEAFGHEASRALREAQVLGKSLSNDEIQLIVRGRLAQLSAVGEQDAKGAVAATQALGKLRGVQSFEPELSLNIFQHISENCPAEWKERYAVTEGESKVIEGEMPILPEPGMLHTPLVSGEVITPDTPPKPQLTVEQEIEQIRVAAGPEKKCLLRQ